MEFWHAFENLVAGWGLPSIIARLSIAFCIGLVVGSDREYKNRGAGLRTHVLACVAAAIVMITSEYIYRAFPDATADMNRLSAQVVSGVSFLGAGTILVTGRSHVRGLTTAAGLWASTCAGLCVGIGFLDGAVVGTLFIVVALKLLNSLDARIRNASNHFDLYLEFESNHGIKQFIGICREEGVSFSDLRISKAIAAEDGPSVTVSIKLPKAEAKAPFFEQLGEEEAITFFEEI